MVLLLISHRENDTQKICNCQRKKNRSRIFKSNTLQLYTRNITDIFRLIYRTRKYWGGDRGECERESWTSTRVTFIPYIEITTLQLIEFFWLISSPFNIFMQHYCSIFLMGKEAQRWQLHWLRSPSQEVVELEGTLANALK